jgi:hypothetical protein
VASVEQAQRLLSVCSVDLKSRCNQLVDGEEKYQEVGGVSGESAHAVNGLDEDGERMSRVSRLVVVMGNNFRKS